MKKIIILGIIVLVIAILAAFVVFRKPKHNKVFLYWNKQFAHTRWAVDGIDSGNPDDYLSFGATYEDCIYKGEPCYRYLFMHDKTRAPYSELKILLSSVKSSIGYNQYHGEIEVLYLISENGNKRLIIVDERKINIIKTFLPLEAKQMID